MEKSRKEAVCIIVLLSIILFAFLVFYFTRPLVLYVSSSSLYEEYGNGLEKPNRLTFSYRVKFVDDSTLKIGKASLVILDPLAKEIDDIQIKSARWGNSNRDEDISFLIDEKRMWGVAIAESCAFLYPEGNTEAEDILDYLKTLDSNVLGLGYRGRISVANYQEISDRLTENGIERVLLYEPQTSTMILSYEDAMFYVDFRDYATLGRRKNVTGIVPDWDSAIKEALAIDSGDISFDYTLSSSH